MSIRTSTDSPLRRAASTLGLAVLGLCLSLAPLGCASAPSDNAGAREVRTDHARAQKAALTQELLLTMMDREALYTLSGPAVRLKPMSSGFFSRKLDSSEQGTDAWSTAVNDIDLARAILADTFQGTQFEAGVLVFATAHEGTRHIDAFIVHTPSLRALLQRHATFFEPLGLTPSSTATEVVVTVERLPREDRFRGYGYLFGYPDLAVDFFVMADQAARAKEAAGEGAPRGPGKDRSFLHIPTFESPTGRFTYAVPPDHTPTPEDLALAQRAAPILEHYKALRARAASTQGNPQPDATGLLRALLRDEN